MTDATEFEEDGVIIVEGRRRRCRSPKCAASGRLSRSQSEGSASAVRAGRIHQGGCWRPAGSASASAPRRA